MNKKEFSPYRSFVYLILGIFATEYFIMFVMEHSIQHTKYLTFLDSLFLVAIISPLIYAFTVKPLQSKITELKKADAIVQKYTEELQSEYHAITDALQESVIVSMADEKGNITYVNQKFIEVSKYSENELIGQNHRILKSGHQPASLFTDLWATISSGKIWRGELKNRAKDGSYYWIDATIVPILGTDSKPKSYVALRTVITDKKETEEKLKQHMKEMGEENAKDEALLASIGEGMIATDDAGKIIAMNHAAEKILGWNKEDLMGEKATDMILVMDENGEMVPPEKHAISVATTKGVPIASNIMQYVHKKDGRRTPVGVTVNPVILEGKIIGAIAIFRDITKEKELEETRRDLLSLASHQLRTPLSGTKWLIETLIKGLHGPLTKEQEEYLGEIYKINERMTSLVHDMLSVLRMESGITPTKKEQISTISLIHSIFEGLHGAAKNKNITLRLTEGEDCTINTDPLLLRNVLEGLISNAINYSNPGSEAVVSIEKKPTELVIAVQDFGIGIPENEQRQIFERFYRASNAKTFDTRGTGLGLYIASMLALKIGATLAFESEENKGSTFYVHIPLEEQLTEGTIDNDTGV